MTSKQDTPDIEAIRKRQKARRRVMPLFSSTAADGVTKIENLPSWKTQECMDDCDSLLADNERLRARVAELEATIEQAMTSKQDKPDVEANNLQAAILQTRHALRVIGAMPEGASKVMAEVEIKHSATLLTALDQKQAELDAKDRELKLWQSIADNWAKDREELRDDCEQKDALLRKKLQNSDFVACSKDNHCLPVCDNCQLDWDIAAELEKDND